MALTNAEKYVKARRDLDLMYSLLTAEELKQVAEGLRWLERMGSVHVGPKRRGRPPGSKNGGKQPAQQQTIAAVVEGGATLAEKEG